ncbi:MAG TPA: CheR family methyltransferase, partial [Noviherbaspirillum sp.]|nr:CheR family methyltransferase [Noviherbaspirillum sp.]
MLTETAHTGAVPGRVAFPVVGIGASAGGLPALVTLLENMPSSPGMALVVILHLAPDQPSAVDRVLQRATDMAVAQAGQREFIMPDHVYVIPPDRSLRMEDGYLYVEPLDHPAHGRLVTIDRFFRTLAEAQKERAIGIVLSGMGTDGTAGLARIKEQGGVTIVQLPSDAEESSMPQAVITAGMADFVMSAAQIPQKLVELRDITQALHQIGRSPGPLAPEAPQAGREAEVLDGIFTVLHARTGHDFHKYKRPTLMRRLERRLQVRGLTDLDSYYQLLKKDSSEAHALLKDLLIGVTSFFRDRKAFDALEQQAVAQILRASPDGAEVRAWVAACSTGEEAYSVAMLLNDKAQTMGLQRKIQVFASDIDEQAIHTARAGLYPPGIADDVSPDRLRRYFTMEGERYRVRKTLRDQVLFATHNLLRDPGFSRLDLITCRNFLIYLNREMHQYVLETFHFALNPGGFLFLGSAESADAASHCFAPVDLRHRIYRAKALPRAEFRVPLPPTVAPKPLAPDGSQHQDFSARSRRPSSYADIHLRKLIELAAPSILL